MIIMIIISDDILWHQIFVIAPILPYDIRHYSITQLAYLPAEVLRLHLSFQLLVTSGSKAVIAKCLHDTLHIGYMHGTVVPKVAHWP